VHPETQREEREPQKEELETHRDLGGGGVETQKWENSYPERIGNCCPPKGEQRPKEGVRSPERGDREPESKKCNFLLTRKGYY
jgi:hypothetical protein